MVKGIDVSEWQGHINWTRVANPGDPTRAPKNAVKFAVIKVTEGIVTKADPDPVDPRFAENWRGARAAGLIRGAYVFSRPQPGRNPAAEVNTALRAIEEAGGLRREGDLPLTLDIEWSEGLDSKELEEWVRGWIRTAKRKTGKKPIIYTGAWWRNNRLSFRVKARLWLAAYVTDPKPYVPRPSFRRWWFWQRTSSGSVAGIDGHVDINVFRGRLRRLRKFARLGRHPKHRDNASGGVAPPPKDKKPQRPGPPKGAPKNLPVRFYDRWEKPWKGYGGHFKKWLWDNGYVSPNFTRQEWACKCGTPVPSSLRKNAQRHAENLEKLRHELGDKPLVGISFFRAKWYNDQIGGASLSRHVQADAMNISAAVVDSFGRERFLAACRKVGFGTKIGGLGIYPGGSVHLDSRGYPANWSSW